MAMKHLITIFVVVVVLMATQQAQAQSTTIGLNLNISGVVFCSVNATLNSTAPIPPFPNATVQLVCGGNVVASARTNAMGAFSINATPLQFILSLFPQSCRVVVTTPLSACNATLPSTGRLVGQPLQFVGITIRGLLSILNFLVPGFMLQ